MDRVEDRDVHVGVFVAVPGRGLVRLSLPSPVRFLASTHLAVLVAMRDGRVRVVHRAADAGVLMPASAPSTPIPGAGDLVITPLDFPGRVEDMAAGTQHALFLVREERATGGMRLYAWGANTDGQCGVTVGSTRFRAPVAVRATSFLDVRRVFAGSAYSAAVLHSGGIAVWGGLQSYTGAAPRAVVYPSACFSGFSADSDQVAGGATSSGASQVAVGDVSDLTACS